MKAVDNASEVAAARLRMAFELFETGLDTMRQKLRREHPEWTEAQVEADRADHLAGDREVGLHDGVRRHHAAAADEDVDHHAGSPYRRPVPIARRPSSNAWSVAPMSASECASERYILAARFASTPRASSSPPSCWMMRESALRLER